jgi:hypothetical protein
MSDTPTPGQIAYDAFAASMTRKHASWGMPPFADLRPAPDYQDAWEAAAQAVRDAWQAQEETPRCRWCGQPVAEHPQDGEPWHCRLSDGPQLPLEADHA